LCFCYFKFHVLPSSFFTQHFLHSSMLASKILSLLHFPRDIFFVSSACVFSSILTHCRGVYYCPENPCTSCSFLCLFISIRAVRGAKLTSTSKPSTYCSCTLLDDKGEELPSQSQKTKVVNSATNPVWEQILELYVYNLPHLTPCFIHPPHATLAV
jgi:hypothetical protein